MGCCSVQAFPCMTLALRINKVNARKWETLQRLLWESISETVGDFLVVIKLPETSLEMVLSPPCCLHSDSHDSYVGSGEMQSAWILQWYVYKLRKRVVCQVGLYCFSSCTVLEAQDSVKSRTKFFRAPKRSGTSALITVQGFDDSQYMNCLEIATPLQP